MDPKRKFTWCPERAIPICIHWWPEIHSHVCIRTPGAPLKKPMCSQPALYLDFCDLDPIAISRTEAFKKDPEKVKLLIDDCMKEAQAKAVIDFVESRPLGELVVINCEAGISRSAGVVLALRRHYGGDEEEIFSKACPNIHVTSLVSRALRSLGMPDSKKCGICGTLQEGEWPHTEAACTNALFRKLGKFKEEGYNLIIKMIPEWADRESQGASIKQALEDAAERILRM
jgi:predicted protein tyrosine phosphatase